MGEKRGEGHKKMEESKEVDGNNGVERYSSCTGDQRRRWTLLSRCGAGTTKTGERSDSVADPRPETPR